MLAAAKRFLIYKINSEKIKFDNTNLKFAIDNLKKKKADDATSCRTNGIPKI